MTLAAQGPHFLSWYQSHLLQNPKVDSASTTIFSNRRWLDTGSKTQGPTHRVQDTGGWTQVAEHRWLDTGGWTQVAGHRWLDTGGWTQILEKFCVWSPAFSSLELAGLKETSRGVGERGCLKSSLAPDG